MTRSEPPARISWSAPDPPLSTWERDELESVDMPVSYSYVPHVPPPAPPVARKAEPETPGEPVFIAHSLTTVLAAVVAAGWVVIPSATLNAVITVASFAVSTVGAVLARSKVSPLKGKIWEAIQAQVAAELARQQQR